MTLFLSRTREYCYFQAVVGYEIGDERWRRLRAINIEGVRWGGRSRREKVWVGKKREVLALFSCVRARDRLTDRQKCAFMLVFI